MRIWGILFVLFLASCSSGAKVTVLPEPELVIQAPNISEPNISEPIPEPEIVKQVSGRNWYTMSLELAIINGLLIMV